MRAISHNSTNRHKTAAELPENNVGSDVPFSKLTYRLEGNRRKIYPSSLRKTVSLPRLAERAFGERV